MLCDIDHFKAYNDSYGHLAGDALLKRFAGTIGDNMRTGDTCYRYGGEEFLVILTEQDLEGGRAAAERLRQGVEALGIENAGAAMSGGAACGGAEVVTISVGVARLSPRKGGSPEEELVREADEALYRAKTAGRNRVEVHVDEPWAE